jgi:hypothetical protein
MPLTRFLQDTSFGPDEIALMVAAYEAALRELDLIGQADPRAMTLAKTIVAIAKQGARINDHGSIASSRAPHTAPGREGRAVIFRSVMPSRRPCAAARDVRPERAEDPNAEPGRGRYAECY